MKKGDIVLVVFPFTDLSGSKLRPALVVAATQNEVTVCFITTQLKWIDINDVILTPDSGNGIKKPSLIRISKIATLDKIIVKGLLGAVSNTLLTEVEQKMKVYLQLP